MSKFKKGDTAYINASGAGWIKVAIIRASGNYYTIRRLDRPTAFGVPGHRLLTENEYLALMDRIRTVHPVRAYSTRNAQLL